MVWYAKMGNENKQGVIGVKEGHEIIKKLQLKSYEGGKKANDNVASRVDECSSC